MSAKTPSSKGKQDLPAGRHNRDSTVTAREHYRREKARRASDRHPDSELLEAAKREYLALLAEGVAKGKGGRPKKKPARAVDTDIEDEEAEETEETGEHEENAESEAPEE